MSLIRYNQINTSDLTGNGTKLVTQSGATTTNRPLLYDANGNAIAGSVQGNTTTVQMASGSPTTGNLLKFDASGNAVDSGISGISGGLLATPAGWASLSAPPSSGWSTISPAGLGTPTLTTGTGYVKLVTSSQTEWEYAKRACPSTPYTISAHIYICPVGLSGAQAVCLGFCDNTGASRFLSINSSAGAFIQSENSSGGFVASTGVSFTNMSLGLWVLLTDDGVNRKWSLSPNGVDWFVVLSETRTTFITPTNNIIGVYLNAIHVDSWS